MQPTPFKIYNASAGSGKTHTLVKEYLKIALDNQKSYKNILAITFTNKAVNEMKERILTSLFDFGLTDLPERSQSLFQDLLFEINISAEALQKKSSDTLKSILHNYAYFDISTIDKFTHRVIRTFAKDLKLPQNFEPVVETDLLLDEAVSRVLQQAGSDEQLTKVLIDFALEKIDDNRSWDIAFDLNKIGKLIFQENHASHLEKLASKKMGDFLALKKHVAMRIAAVEKEMISVSTEVLSEIEKNGLQFDDFSGGYFPKLIQKISAHNFDMDLNKAWVKKFESVPLYPKRVSEENKVVLDSLQANFISLFNSIQNLYPDYLFLKNVRRNIVPLTVLSVIQHEVNEIGKERDQIPIFKFNQIISNQIKDQPAPFIYERLGEKYRHYFIDEFQDTSASQWNNLIPLIDNALASEDGSLFLVGDAKQAIYRWRGGKAEQLLNLAIGRENPFVVRPQTKDLPTNFRSFAEIVSFNNDFFTWSSAHLGNEIYQNLYRDGNNQETNTKKGGLIKLHFVAQEDEKQTDELYCEQVLSILQEVQLKNHPLKDIAILVRSKNKGIVLADYLSEKGIPILSSESLLLKSSFKVHFLVNLLTYAGGLKEVALAYEILAFLAPTGSERHAFIHHNRTNFEDFLKEQYDFSIDRFGRSSTYDGLEYAIRQFDLVPDSDAYVIFLMDFVLDVEQREGGGIQSFLTLWEKKKEKLAIASPENMDAVRIMTIHKAKGLEFPIVIFPFANEEIFKRRDKMMWAPTDPGSFHGFNEVLLSEKTELTNYTNMASSLFEAEEQKMLLDALNILYVALTRAEKALYIISEKKSRQSANLKIGRYSDLFIDYLKGKNLWSDEIPTYAIGILEEHSENTIPVDCNEIFPYPYSYRDGPNFKIVTAGAMLWDSEREEAITHGTLIHYILGLIETEEDIDNALTLALKNSTIGQNEVSAIRNKVENVIGHTSLKQFFTDKYTILNERDILTDKGRLLRPDRICIYDNEATLIDYKTGKKNPNHKEQVYSYADALEQMGYLVKNKIIVYIDTEVNPEFI